MKVGNAVTKSFRNDDIIICVEYLLNGCFEGYKIKGYWIVKDLTEEDIHVGNNINYFIIDKKPKGISYLKKEII